MEKQRLRSAKNSTLPLTSVIPDHETFEQVNALLAEALKIKEQLGDLQDREKEIREEMGAIAAAYDLKGFRYGLAGFEYHGYTTRKTLSKEKLLSNGVPAETIANSMEEGEPFLMTKFVAFDLE